MSNTSGSYVFANVDKLEQLRLKKAMSLEQLKERAESRGMARQTVQRIFDPNKRSQFKKLQAILDLLDAPDDFDAYVLEHDQIVDRTIAQWDIDSKVTNWMQAANGLTYRVYKLRHVKLPSRLARGKYYDLDDVGDEDSQAMETLLLRHPQVCDRLSISHRFPVSLQLEYTQDKKHFWVVDNWPPGRCLTELVPKEKGLSPEHASVIMRNLAESLTQLHDNDIIIRDLRPSCIFVSENNEVHLTDFELAKLVDGSPTVRRGELLPASFRAPEVGGPIVNNAADYYSWAQIYVFVTTGRYPPTPARSEVVDSLGFPKSVDRFVRHCMNLDSELRPTTFAKVINQLTK